MIRNLIGGIAIGIANVIPGVSGGTMMVVLGIFENMMESISGVFKPNNPDRMKQIIFLLQVLIGAGIGLVGFAKVLNFLFAEYPTETIYWFIGLVIFSIPLFLKSEMKEEKINWIWVIIGMATIFIFEFFGPEKGNIAVNPEFPAVTLMHCVTMVLAGFIGGFAMLLPGISGSMMLLIAGQYYLFKSYLAAVTSFSLDVLIPLGFLGVGILLGIVASAAVTSIALKKNKVGTLSYILGLIIASSIVLIPFNVGYTPVLVISCIATFAFGGFVVYLLNKVV